MCAGLAGRRLPKGAGAASGLAGEDRDRPAGRGGGGEDHGRGACGEGAADCRLEHRLAGFEATLGTATKFEHEAVAAAAIVIGEGKDAPDEAELLRWRGGWLGERSLGLNGGFVLGMRRPGRAHHGTPQWPGARGFAVTSVTPKPDSRRSVLGWGHGKGMGIAIGTGCAVI